MPHARLACGWMDTYDRDVCLHAHVGWLLKQNDFSPPYPTGKARTANRSDHQIPAEQRRQQIFQHAKRVCPHSLARGRP